MKNRFITILSVLCALILMISAVSAFADQPATGTDLPESETQEKETMPAEQQDDALPEPEAVSEQEPEQQEKAEPEETKPEEETAAPEEAEQPQQDIPQEEAEEKPEEKTEESRTSAEMIISKAVRIGSIWEGLTKDTSPAILKLDLDQAQTVHLIVEGKKVVWATVEKSDRPEATPQKVLSDPETKRLIISFEAEKGSYLIKIGPEEPNRNAKVTVTILDDEGYETWLRKLPEETEEEQPEIPEQPEEPEQNEEQEQSEPEQPGEEQPAETEPENVIQEPDTEKEPQQETEQEATEPAETEPESEDEAEETENKPESVLDAERSIDVDLTWDTANPQIGDTAHLKATLHGYDELRYTLQWQYSADDQNWTDAVGETKDNIDITISAENNYYYWRILVYIEQPAEE